MSSPLRILCLEDDLADAELLQDTLDTEGIACVLTRVESEGEFESALQQGRFDLILADYTLPVFDGLSALKIVRARLPEVPFIFVSGTLGEEVAIEALKMGATDYVFKTRLSRLVPAIRRALREAEEKAERKRAEEAARRSEKELRDAIEIIPAMVFIALPGPANAFANRRWREYTGLSAQDTSGSGWQAAIHPEDLERHAKEWELSSATGRPFEDEARFRRAADGQYRWFLTRAVPLHDDRGNVLKWYGVLTDIEDRKRAEEQRERLRQLEAELAHMDRVSILGELTASIAHEVNQPLSGIVSSGSACLRWLAADPPNLEEARESVRRIVGAGKHAGDVIARIRALAKQTAAPKERLDLNETIREVLVLVGDEAKRDTVIIRTLFAEGLSPVLGDRVQLQQVVLNLVINGIEAMSSVSSRPRELVITTRNGEQAQVQVTVEDSGIGIDASVMEKIFDPFYTTKPTGMGMGLSISRSILQNHGGRLWATAKERPGTSFHFALPKCREE
jgi:PAS domain S-box-containing protein